MKHGIFAISRLNCKGSTSNRSVADCVVVAFNKWHKLSLHKIRVTLAFAGFWDRRPDPLASLNLFLKVDNSARHPASFWSAKPQRET